MKVFQICFIIIFLFAFAKRINTVDPKLKDIQALLDNRNPNCVAYRNSVNAYFKSIAPDRMCQLQCHNLDSFLAGEIEGWYIPNYLPVEKKNCGTVVDDCNYKFDSKYIFGNLFYQVLLQAEVFVQAIMEKSYLVYCLDRE